MLTHQFNIYRNTKFFASPRLNSFYNMQEHKQINKVYYLAFIELHFEIKMQQVDGAKRQ